VQQYTSFFKGHKQITNTTKLNLSQDKEKSDQISQYIPSTISNILFLKYFKKYICHEN